MPEYVMVATADHDLHLIEGDMTLVKMKVERKAWLETIDKHLVRCNQVVSIWVPLPEEVEGWMSSGEVDAESTLYYNDAI